MAPLAIFDIDGTLVDSRRIIALAMDEAFQREGLPQPGYDVTRKIVGLSLEVAIDRIAPSGVDHDGVKRLTQYYKDAFIAARQDPKLQSPLYAGAMNILDNLCHAGWEIGVATGKSRRGLDTVIERMQLGDYFSAHYCADDGPGKPHPFMVDANLKALSRSPEEAVMIGDTSFDIHMAQAAGVANIGVDWGFHTREELKIARADVIVSDMKALGSELNKFAERRAV